MRWRLAAGVVAAAWVGCRPAPLPEEPGAKPYHDAVVLFAKLSDDTQDLSYRDPRFDDVLSLCAQVPLGTELRPKADALAGRIREARVQADSSDRASAILKAQAEAAPAFMPEPRVVFPTAAPAPPPANVAAPQQEALPSGGLGISATPGARPFDLTKPRPLPDWYRQKGFFGLKPDGTNEAPAAPPPSDAVSGAAPSAPPAPRPAAAPKSTPPDPQAPPPVFGLPGPAGHAFVPPQPQ